MYVGGWLGALQQAQASGVRLHWYFTYTWFCVLCGRTETTRERRYTAKPERAEDRCYYHEGACGCHFC